TNPQVNFINLANNLGLTDPALAVNRPGDPAHVFVQPLKLGLTGMIPETISSLPRFYTWMTYILPGDSTITASFTPYNTPVTVTKATTTTNAPQNLWLLDTGLLSVSTLLPGALLPTSVVSDHQASGMSLSVYVRAGTASSLLFYIKNVGHANSLMSSLSGSIAAFTNVPANGVTTFTLVVSNTSNFGIPPSTTARVL